MATPLNANVLRAMRNGSRPLPELREVAGSPSQTTLRGHLRHLAALGIVEPHRQQVFPGALAFELTASGEDLLLVADVLEAWLLAAPAGPIPLGTPAAKRVLKALVDGWSTTIVRAVAARPLTLIDLNGLISDLNYPSIERRLRAMRKAGMLEAAPNEANGTPYAPSAWLRMAIAPLAAAARWERRQLPAGSTPIGRLDVESAYLLAIPMLSLPDSISGCCRLAVEFRNGDDHVPAGVVVQIREGSVVSCIADLRTRAPAWACGSAAAWLRAVIDGKAAELETGGDTQLASVLVEGLHNLLFGMRKAALGTAVVP